jgi:hypothetical protein
MGTITRPTSIHNSTGTNPAGWRRCWREQAQIDRTDWTSLLDAADEVLLHLRLHHVTAVSS